MPLLSQHKDFPKGTIVPVRKMIGRVRELNAFFTRKLQIIQNKMKLLTDGVDLFIPSILNEDKTIKEWQS